MSETIEETEDLDELREQIKELERKLEDAEDEIRDLEGEIDMAPSDEDVSEAHEQSRETYEAALRLCAEYCTCGGHGPFDAAACPACNVQHAIRREVIP